MVFVGVGTDDRLNREAAIAEVVVCRDVHGFQIVKECAPFVPGHVLTAGDYIVAVKGGHGNESDILNIEFCSEVCVFLDHSIVGFLAIIYQVHLVDTHEDVRDLQKGGNEGVAFGLFDNSFARIDKDEGKVGGRSTSYHVTGILNVSWRICNDEFTLGCSKVAVGNIDGDALLAFVFKAVCEEAEVDVI